MTDDDPHSLLFLSCDLVGSTSFKQNVKNWQATFLSFYRQFPQSLTLLANPADQLTFDLWKPIGDELIFTVRVRHERQILAAVRVWLQALTDYERGPLGKITPPLATKGGAFLATFPGPDSAATVPRTPAVEASDQNVIELNRRALGGPREHDKYLYDFFGPSIDTGFRVISQCSARHFTLSVEVTWALLRAAHDQALELDDLVWIDGLGLKGVWGGREYPLFALDREHEDDVHKALRRLHNRQLRRDEVEALCRACCDDPRWPSALYLPDSGFDEFKRVPVDPLEVDEVAMTGGVTVDGLEQQVALDDEGDALEEKPPMP